MLGLELHLLFEKKLHQFGVGRNLKPIGSTTFGRNSAAPSSWLQYSFKRPSQAQQFRIAIRLVAFNDLIANPDERESQSPPRPPAPA